MKINSPLSVKWECISIKSHKSEHASPFHHFQSIPYKITYSDTNLVAYTYVQAALYIFQKDEGRETEIVRE